METIMKVYQAIGWVYLATEIQCLAPSVPCRARANAETAQGWSGLPIWL